MFSFVEFFLVAVCDDVEIYKIIDVYVKLCILHHFENLFFSLHAAISIIDEINGCSVCGVHIVRT